MRTSIIAAVAANRTIGRDNGLPWGRLPADMKWFKRQTMGHTMILGRKTFESIGSRPLPGRPLVVITRKDIDAPAGVRIVHTLDEALAAAREQENEEAFIAGGAEIYRQALPRTDRMYLTWIGEEFPGDTFFPAFDPSGWRVVSEEPHEADGENPYPYTFQILDRA